MDSILETIKKLLGIEEDYTQFDPDIILNINSALMSLNQIGIGPVDGYGMFITGNDDTWTDLLGDRKDLESVKIYIYLKTRLVFDPPQSGFLLDAITKQLTEIEWRLNVQVEGGSL